MSFNVETVSKAGVRVVIVPDKGFGDHCLTTGPLNFKLGGRRKIKCRVIAFNWGRQPEVYFHGLN